MVDSAADKAAILELLHRNRFAIWTNDYELWASCFVQEPYLVRWGWWSGGGAFIRRGWDAISDRVRRDGMPARNDANASDTQIVHLEIEIRGDVAWATFLQHYPEYNYNGHVGPGLTHEMRILERHDGEWKIALLGFIDSNAEHAGALAMRLSGEGEVLWQSPDLGAELADNDDIVVRNGRLRFRNSRANRQLQEALRWAAEQDAGYMPRQGSVPIVIEAGEGIASRVYWLTTHTGMIFFSVASNPELDRNRLAQAALTFGLSPAQTRLAALIAEGLSLVEIAERMGITQNTARTHLNRVFDKVGVRTQPALVRVLLLAATPLQGSSDPSSLYSNRMTDPRPSDS
ncbi:LuxR C-terminal-related transcriptional regulator [Devosia sp. RR2S18]|uniref:LuxR C-terminal-related transcriptional regulator n=1 Tax=Devosia rhizosphaerae TaxID=3049774 RepID=UPI002540C711|nr:LuxR C-terminal-related transcriptional regulator [Devosia sp. RR2S18]WIJ26415.1 LuxR C-terminal-related transcriptional regulator [Devosia sp. RR2S18]